MQIGKEHGVKEEGGEIQKREGSQKGDKESQVNDQFRISHFSAYSSISDHRKTESLQEGPTGACSLILGIYMNTHTGLRGITD